ncbi:MAG TPA: 4-(cytidine 5'-diphospho)-2-C-methyl-D-erythritol kinase [Usitatibacter sp.]|nr:4-(cytidine 5'-diphospho)-2-C-methyl-D-erythritol kinase [Usitatibacter sp.]
MRLPGPGYPAPAKLNLFLHVVGRRPDGYHLLQAAFTLIDRCDEIRIRVRSDGAIARVNDVPGVRPEDDLAVRAARSLQRATGTAMGADIEVEKRIPMGGGLGGGSSDAATVLLALDRLWGTRVPAAELRSLGESLGADVPFFLFGKPAWVEGIGERISPLAVPPRWYAVLEPPEPVPTAAIFAAPELTRDTEPLKMEDFSAHPERVFGEGLANDLERVAVARFPAVGARLAWLRARAPARMTGSGGCVFAAFESREAAQRVIDGLPEGMQGFVARGLDRHPMRDQV